MKSKSSCFSSFFYLYHTLAYYWSIPLLFWNSRNKLYGCSGRWMLPIRLFSSCDYGGGGGYFHQNRTWMCLPDLKNLTFSIPNFCTISHPSVCHFRKKGVQFWPNGVLFTIICPKYTRFMLFGLLRLWLKPPPIVIPNFAKKRPKRQAHMATDHKELHQ